MPATLAIHVQPRAKRTEVVGWYGDAVKIRLASPPIDGAANAELLRHLADTLRIPASHIHLRSGRASHRKLIEIDSLEIANVLELLGVGHDGP